MFGQDKWVIDNWHHTNSGRTGFWKCNNAIHMSSICAIYIYATAQNQRNYHWVKTFLEISRKIDNNESLSFQTLILLRYLA